MVKENKKRVVGKNEILILLGTLILVGFLSYAFATTTIKNPTSSLGNYSHNLFLNCSTTLNYTGGIGNSKGYNVTFYYNASGGATANVSSAVIVTLWNETDTDANFNTTININTWADANGFTGPGYNISCMADNGTDQEWASSLRNITVDNSNPAVVFINSNISNNGNYSAIANFTINVSVIDAIVGMTNASGGRNNGTAGNGPGAGFVFLNITNSSGGKAPTKNWTLAGYSGAGDYYTFSLDLSQYSDGKYNITVFANESTWYGLMNASGNNSGPGDLVNHINNTQGIQFTVDRTAPSSVTLTNTTDTTTTQIVATVTAIDATSGIHHCVADSSSGLTIVPTGTQGTLTLTHTGLECGTSYSYTVTCYDQLGNLKASEPTSFSTSSCSVSDSGTGNGGGITPPITTNAIEKTFILNLVPSTEGVLSGFQDAMGVKEIKLRVNEAVNNVKVTVKKYDTQPSEITVAKTGQVHKYLQITTVNLGSKLEGATLEFKVQKSWLTDNGIDKSNIALFHLDESAGTWGELSSVYKEEDATYYYYEAQVPSFSYFAIAEKSVTLPEAPPEETPPVETPTTTFLKQNWIWMVVGVVVLLGVVGALLTKKGKRKKR
jgi:PGF-pre-PGF domain-containing protein